MYYRITGAAIGRLPEIAGVYDCIARVAGTT